MYATAAATAASGERGLSTYSTLLLRVQNADTSHKKSFLDL
ncbi:hypothetical protein SAMN05216604_12853 [Pseudomonas agarici]|nr:hypothetical protein SAMN05216604_12853 [Pseudomonas agarici]